MPIVHQKSHTQERVSSHDAGQTLVVNNLTFAYPDGHKALDAVSISIENREKVALVGPNGAGKSTLMLHLNGILEGEGIIQVGGLELKKANLPLIRSKVGMVFQNPDDQLFSPTVFDDVAFGPLHMGYSEVEVKERVDRALARVGMEAYENRLSFHLSVGEKKRIAIATVLSMDPEILVLDEPSAGLDPRARRQLIALLNNLQITMFISTHDMLLVQELLPRMVIMDEGRIVADGPTEHLLQNSELLAAHGLELPKILSV
ncbi:MAG: ATP-binding cassette domain-containing protein [Anaerolineae bacterium]|nr:ATP-binding cassette domain-containing protein [Anaerolineae bacterium]